MKNAEDNSSAKPSKPAPSTQEVPPTPPYPDWPSSIQACYGPRGTPPFFASTVASPTPHPYMWGTQHPMTSPYGTPVPYPDLYPPGAVYHHPNMAPAPIAAIPKTDEGKVANGKDRSSAKKLKGSSAAKVVDSKTVSGSGNDGAASQSAESGSEGSSDGSDENGTQQDYGANKKGSFEQMLADASAHGNNPGRSIVPVHGTNLNMGMDLWNPSNGVPGAVRPNSSSANVPPGVIMNDQWIQDERELKRQKRKQSNRESARRSRLRKQAECEELQVRVENLTNDNQSLKDELQRLSEECEKLTSENNSIKEELTQICGPEAVANIEKSSPTDEVMR